MRHLSRKWNIDVAAFVETQTNSRQVSEESQFDNLFIRETYRRNVVANNVAANKLLTGGSQPKFQKELHNHQHCHY